METTNPSVKVFSSENTINDKTPLEEITKFGKKFPSTKECPGGRKNPSPSKRESTNDKRKLQIRFGADNPGCKN
ncbi:hypothetical protein TNCV_3961881 [Trichonephila clavipes]|nr:hypothetical protein TNCV_3961881 [Trichonephila clavipes]